MKKPALPFIDATKLSLNEWLAKISAPDFDEQYIIADYRFPTDEMCDAYLETASQRTDREIKDLLRHFIIPSGTLGSDKNSLQSLHGLSATEIKRLLDETEFLRRLLRGAAWEGVTWILDLLPNYPREAIAVLSNYITAHMQHLSDQRWDGLSDAIIVIRAKYLHASHTSECLFELSPRNFEELVATHYQKDGYEVILGSGSKDGGVDITATKQNAGSFETLLIQCKLYEDTVGVEKVRELYGVVENRRATLGVLFTPSRFSAEAMKFATESKRMLLVDFAAMDRLFNSTLGARWPNQIETILLVYRQSKVTRKPKLIPTP